MHPRTRLGILSASLALTASFAAPAHAERQSGADATSDVLVMTFHDDGTQTRVVDESRVEGDISGFVTNHGVDRLAARVTFRDLHPFKQQRFFLLGVTTDTGLKRWLTVKFTYEPVHGKRLLTDPADNSIIACTGMTSTADYESNWIYVSIPRSCLGNPKWVRTGATYDREVPWRAFFDDARTDGTFPETEPTPGPAVWTGERSTLLGL